MKEPQEATSTANSDDNDVIITSSQQIPNRGEIIKGTGAHKEMLTAEEIKFINLVARGYSATTAYRESYPAKSKLTYATIRYNASRLLTNPNIGTEIEVKKSTLALIARLSEDRIIETLTDGKQGSRAVTDVSLAMYEHANGKAKQQIETTTKSISVNIDLTGKVTDTQATEHRDARAQV